MDKTAKQLQCRVAKLTACMDISTELIHCAVDLDAILDDYLVRLIRQVVYIPAKEVLEVPASWWDAVKQRFMPNWALRHWPVCLTRYEARAFLPNVAPPLKGAVLRWEQLEDHDTLNG